MGSGRAGLKSALAAFASASSLPENLNLPSELISQYQEEWRVIRDLRRDISKLEVILDTGITRYEDINMEIGSRTQETYTYRDNEYDSLSGETHWERRFSRGDWEVRTVTRTLLTSNANSFQLRADLDAYEGSSRFFARSWQAEIPRKLV
jgi:hypothetical protein